MTANKTILDEEVAPAATVRDGKTASGTVRDEPSGAPPGGGSIRVVVPADLKKRFRVTRQLPTRGSEADLLLAEEKKKNGRQVVLKLYRPGIAPKTDVLERIAKAESAHVIGLYEHGQTAEGVWYEILEYAAGASLRELLTGTPLPGEEVRAIASELHEALRHLHGHDILHRDLKPDNILIRSRSPLDLVLTDFGIASIAVGSHHLTGGNRTPMYSAPEAASGLISKASDYWSLGMILLESLSGRHPFSGMSEAVISQHLATRPVDLSGIADSRWQLLCRGLLIRDPSKRWGEAEVGRWLAGDTTLSVAEEKPTTRATGRRAVEPYRLGDRECFTPLELAVALATEWDEGVKRLARGFLLRWFLDDLRDDNLASFVMDLTDNSGLSPDERLQRLIYRLAPDLPPVWKGVDVSPAGLLNLSGQAQTDESARALLDEVVRKELKVYPHPELAELSEKWDRISSEYQAAWEKVGSAGGNLNKLRPKNDPAPLFIRLLLDETAVSSRREELAGEAEALSPCPWYAALGSAREVEVGTLAVMSLTMVRAREWVKREERERQELVELLKKMESDKCELMESDINGFPLMDFINDDEINEINSNINKIKNAIEGLDFISNILSVINSTDIANTITGIRRIGLNRLKKHLSENIDKLNCHNNKSGNMDIPGGGPLGCIYMVITLGITGEITNSIPGFIVCYILITYILPFAIMAIYVFLRDYYFIPNELKNIRKNSSRYNSTIELIDKLLN